MDPVTLIVSALALGASAGLKSTVATAIGDAYSALRRILGERYRGVDLTPVETPARVGGQARFAR